MFLADGFHLDADRESRILQPVVERQGVETEFVCRRLYRVFNSAIQYGVARRDTVGIRTGLRCSRRNRDRIPAESEAESRESGIYPGDSGESVAPLRIACA